jgi:hypothetical protein
VQIPAISDRPVGVPPRTREFRRVPDQSAFLRNRWAITTLIILCLAVSTSIVGVYYYFLYQDLVGQTQGKLIYVNLGINYGNNEGTLWFNGTEARKGNTLLEITKLVASVDGTEYPGVGTFVNSVNQVKNSNPKYWIWWMWTSHEGWIEGPVASDRYIVEDGETLLWYYEDTSISPLPKPP